MAEVDVLVAGDAAITFAWQLSAPPMPGRTSKLLGTVEPEGRFGGCAPSVALALAGFRHRVALVSWLGDDAYGRAYLEALRTHGVDTGGVEAAAGQATPRALMLYDPSGSAACLHHPSPSGSLRLTEAGLHRPAASRWPAVSPGRAPVTPARLANRRSRTRPGSVMRFSRHSSRPPCAGGCRAMRRRLPPARRPGICSTGRSQHDGEDAPRAPGCLVSRLEIGRRRLTLHPGRRSRPGRHVRRAPDRHPPVE